jgi:hypothetical protein
MAGQGENQWADQLEHPRQGMMSSGERSRWSYIHFEEFPNPIPAEIEDSKEFQKLFSPTRGFRYVPYAGTDSGSAHSLLSFLSYLGELHTQGACTSSIARYVFGGKVQIIPREDPVFDLGEQPTVSADLSRRFHSEFMSQSFKWQDVGGNKINVRDAGKFLFYSLKSTGNAFIEVAMAKTVGSYMGTATVQKAKNCTFVLTDDGEPKMVGVSPYWTQDFIQKYPPRHVPLFPFMEQDEMGTLRTMIQLKNGNYRWYGRPDSMMSFIYQYRQLQDAVYQTKLSRNEYVGRTIIELGQGEPNQLTKDGAAKQNGFANFQEQFEYNTTMAGPNPSTVILTERPYGAEPMTIGSISPNSNENWYKVTDEIAEKRVIEANQWSKRLMGQSATTGLSSDVFLDELLTKQDLILDYRLTIQDIISLVCSLWIEYTGQSQYQGLTYGFSGPSFDFETGKTDGTVND